MPRNIKDTIWQQLVDKQAEWIGGTTIENDSTMGECRCTIGGFELTHKENENSTYEWYEFRVFTPDGETAFSVNIEYFGFGAAADGGLGIFGTYAGADSFELHKPGKGKIA